MRVVTKFTSDLDSTLSTLPLFDEGLCERFGYEMFALSQAEKRRDVPHHTCLQAPPLFLAQPCKGYMICRIVLTNDLVHRKRGLLMVLVVRMMAMDFARSLNWGIVFHESKKVNQML